MYIVWFFLSCKINWIETVPDSTWCLLKLRYWRERGELSTWRVVWVILYGFPSLTAASTALFSPYTRNVCWHWTALSLIGRPWRRRIFTINMGRAGFASLTSLMGLCLLIQYNTPCLQHDRYVNHLSVNISITISVISFRDSTSI